jgi:hypothetical protein
MSDLCADCYQPIRLATEHYDTARWVHVTLLATLACIAEGDLRPAAALLVIR